MLRKDKLQRADTDLKHRIVRLLRCEELEPSVRNFEPHLALDGGEDGLDFYRAIVRNYGGLVKPGGALCFEFGMGQEDAVCAILREGGFAEPELRKDYRGVVRAVAANK